MGISAQQLREWAHEIREVRKDTSGDTASAFYTLAEAVYDVGAALVDALQRFERVPIGGEADGSS